MHPNPWWRPPFNLSRPTVRLDPLGLNPGDGALFLGVGDAQAEGSGVVLNNKTAPAQRRSLIEHVVAADDAAVEHWRLRLGVRLELVQYIVLEDLSLDTCASLLAVLARLDPSSHLQPILEHDWVRYIAAWEQGRCLDRGDLSTSVAILTTVLGHSYLPSHGDAPCERGASELLAAGLCACLGLLEEIVRSSKSPLAPALPRDADPYLRALSHYHFEYQQYLFALQHGTICQLSVPVGDSGRQLRRRILVDALILEEVRPSGILKIFARQDSRNAWGGAGFQLLAIHRQHERMSGNDMTISVEPELGVCLDELWQALEDKENALWQGRRPADRPRDIISYRHGRDDELAGLKRSAPNEPWWDDFGRYTLLAAPKKVQDAAGGWVPGTRLDWNADVVPLLWRLYLPVPQPLLAPAAAYIDTPAAAAAGPNPQPDIGAQGTAAAGGPAPGGPRAKRRCTVSWNGGADPSTILSPTLLAWLAAQSMRLRIDCPADLPHHSAFEVLHLAGGSALVHQDGATFFNDWTSRPLPQAQLDALFDCVAAASHSFGAFIGGGFLQRALQALTQMQSGRFSRRRARQIESEYLSIRTQLLDAERSLQERSDPPALAAVRASLEHHWGIAEQRREALSLLGELHEASLTLWRRIHVQRNRWIAALVVGLGSALTVSGLARAIFITPRSYAWQMLLAGPHLDPAVVTLAAQLQRLERLTLLVTAVALFAGVGAYWFLGLGRDADEEP